jgi:hypothetical protein
MAVLIPFPCLRWLARAGAAPLHALAQARILAGLPGHFFLGVLLLLTAPAVLRAESREYEVKAAFLYNFAQFVVWPESAFTNAGEPFQIGVLGENPFGGDLEETVRGETIHGRQMVVKQSNHAEDLAGCQIVFVSKAEAGHWSEVVSQLGSKPVLTVSESAGFAQHGGIVNFYREGGKVRFEINLEAAEKSGLKLSSELLALGRIVHPESPPK